LLILFSSFFGDNFNLEYSPTIFEILLVAAKQVSIIVENKNFQIKNIITNNFFFILKNLICSKTLMPSPYVDSFGTLVVLEKPCFFSKTSRGKNP